MPRRGLGLNSTFIPHGSYLFLGWISKSQLSLNISPAVSSALPLQADSSLERGTRQDAATASPSEQSFYSRIGRALRHPNPL